MSRSISSLDGITFKAPLRAVMSEAPALANESSSERVFSFNPSIPYSNMKFNAQPSNVSPAPVFSIGLMSEYVGFSVVISL